MPIAAPTSAPTPAVAAVRWVEPGGVWPDDCGRHVQAHGGGVLRVGDTFYWFGEDRSRENAAGRKYVACYSSTDLLTWTFRRQVVDVPPPPGITAPWVLERPHVYHNDRTGQFVLYAHVDDRTYGLAQVAVFESHAVDEPYRFVHRFRPLGMESRDIGQFVDQDGSAYLIFESRPTHGFLIARLSDDYLTVAKQTCLIQAPLEGGAIVHDGDWYYCVGSRLTGWAPNANQYATARSLAGPWSAFTDVAPPAAKTYRSQSTCLLAVAGTRRTTVIFMADQWRPAAQWDSRYLWMPLEIGDGRLRLPPPRPWRVDVGSGAVTFR